jgi:type I restriction enzyme S subunit
MEVVKLSSICDLQNGYAFKSNDYVESSNTLSCRMSNIRPGGRFDLDYNPRFLPDSFKKKYDQYLLKDGDLVIAMTDLANNPKILGVPTIVRKSDQDILLNQRVGKLIVKKPGEVHVPYLQYALSRPENRRYYQKFAGGGLQINIGKKEVLNNKLPLPSLETQQKIAAILDEADRLRQFDKELIKKYEQLSQSLFLEMFGDTWNNPKNWDEYLIEDIASDKKHSIKAGPFGSALKKEFYTPRGYKIYGQEQVIRDDFEYGDYYIDEERFKKLKNCEIKSGDILISLVGTYGKISIVPDEFEKGIINPRLMKISPEISLIRPMFLKILLQSIGVEIQLKNFSRGGTMDIVNVGIIRKVKIPVPPIENQDKFLERRELIQQQMNSLEINNYSSEELFNSLLQKAFKGELVKD